jgi:hypothetical protein
MMHEIFEEMMRPELQNLKIERKKEREKRKI